MMPANIGSVGWKAILSRSYAPFPGKVCERVSLCANPISNSTNRAGEHQYTGEGEIAPACEVINVQ
jgi:hypothetical protein